MKPYGYTYYKAPIVVVSAPPPQNPLKRLLGPTLITLGSIMVTNVLWPIIEHELISSPQLEKTELIAPIPKNMLRENVPAPMTATPPNSESTLIPQAMGADVDYSKASNWFPDAKQATPQTIGSYMLSIPTLNIQNAVVNIGGEDLSKSLIHYAGTALPGQLGSPVIFGHSVLRQFYNPSEKNKDRYMSIFSKIMTMKTGDRIFIDYDGVRYTYEVKDKVEVKPEDLFILEQKYNNRELKLITCVPEGTSLRRGVVVAQLVDLQ